MPKCLLRYLCALVSAIMLTSPCGVAFAVVHFLEKEDIKKQELANVLYNLAESLRFIAVLISPYMPATSPKIWQQLNLEGLKPFAEVQLEDIAEWGGIPAGHQLGEAEQLFPRIEVEKEGADDKAAKAAQAKANKLAKQKKREEQRKLNAKNS